jgi:O-antigen/teichoic acid export membrane protein
MISSKSHRTADIRHLAKGTSITFILRIIGRILLVLIQVLIARYFGPKLYGLYAIGWVISRIVWSFSTLGLQNGVLKFGQEYLHKDNAAFKGIVYDALLISFSIGIILMIVFMAIATWLAGIYEEKELANLIRLFAISFPFLSIITILASLSRVTLKMKYAAIIEDLIPPVVNLTILGVMCLIGTNIYTAVYANVIGYFIAFITSLFFTYKLFPFLFDKNIPVKRFLKKLLMFSLPTFLSGTFSFLTTRLSRLILGVYTSVTSVGIYQAASQNIVSANVIPNSFRIIFAPIIGNLVVNGKQKDIERMYKTTTRWILYINIPLYIIFWLLSPELMLFLFGEEYLTGVEILIVLSIGEFVSTAAGPVPQLMIMTNHQVQWMKLSTIAFMLNITLCFILIPIYDLMGAAIAVSSVNGILHLLGIFYIKRYLNMWPYDFKIWKGLLSILIVIVVLYFTLNYTVISAFIPLFKLLYTGITGIVLLFLLVYLLGLDESDQEIIDLIKGKIKWNKKI